MTNHEILLGNLLAVIHGDGGIDAILESAGWRERCWSFCRPNSLWRRRSSIDVALKEGRVDITCG